MERLVIECDVCGMDVTRQRYLSILSIGFSDAPPLQDRVALCSEECYQQFYRLLPALLVAQEERVKAAVEQAGTLIQPYDVGERLPYAPFYPSGLR